MLLKISLIVSVCPLLVFANSHEVASPQELERWPQFELAARLGDLSPYKKAPEVNVLKDGLLGDCTSRTADVDAYTWV